MSSTAVPTPWAARAGGNGVARPLTRPLAWTLLLVLATGTLGGAVGKDPAETAGSILVLGLENRLPGGKKKKNETWRDLRLGMGVRGRLVQMCADSGAFVLVEERDLVPSVKEALSGYWLTEPSARQLKDLDHVHEASAVDWVLFGTLDFVGVVRNQVKGPVGVERWRYRVKLNLCIHGAGRAQALCHEGTGKSSTTVVTAGFEYRGNDLAWDQAGPAQAVDLALVDAFNHLMPKWEKTYDP